MNKTDNIEREHKVNGASFVINATSFIVGLGQQKSDTFGRLPVTPQFG